MMMRIECIGDFGRSDRGRNRVAAAAAGSGAVPLRQAHDILGYLG
jgi:hypothetical protein